MNYAPTPCIEPNCFQMVERQGRCQKHQKPAFLGNNRSSRLPADWNTRRSVVLRRDKGICYVCSEHTATEVDHIIPNDDNSLENLASICSDCHRKKTAKEGNESKKNSQVKQVWKRYM